MATMGQLAPKRQLSRASNGPTLTSYKILIVVSLVAGWLDDVRREVFAGVLSMK